jgi:RNA polymerase sigma factor (sigma-70 family)
MDIQQVAERVEAARQGDEEAFAALVEAMLRAVARLPAKYRLPLTLHYLEGFDYARVARQLGLAESAAKVRVFRAKEKLRRLLASSCNFGSGFVTA